MSNNRYRREIAQITGIFVRHGLPENEIIHLLGVSTEQFLRWKKSHPELAEALQSTSTADRAEQALLKRALGFTINESSAEELVDKKFEGSLPAFVAAFAKHQRLSDREVDALQAMIDQYRKEHAHD